MSKALQYPPAVNLHHLPSSPRRGSSTLFNSVRVKPDKTKKSLPSPVDTHPSVASTTSNTTPTPTLSSSPLTSNTIMTHESMSTNGGGGNNGAPSTHSDPARLLDDFCVPPRPATEPVPESGKSRLRLPNFLRKSRQSRHHGQDEAPVTDFDQIVNSGGTIHFSLTPTSVLDSHERHRAARQPTAVPARSPRSHSQSSRLTAAEQQRQQHHQERQRQEQEQTQQHTLRKQSSQRKEEEEEDDENEYAAERPEDHEPFPTMTLAMHVGVQAGTDALLTTLNEEDARLERAVVDWLLCA